VLRSNYDEIRMLSTPLSLVSATRMFSHTTYAIVCNIPLCVLTDGTLTQATEIPSHATGQDGSRRGHGGNYSGHKLVELEKVSTINTVFKSRQMDYVLKRQYLHSFIKSQSTKRRE
jgi:hypothetical protein